MTREEFIKVSGLSLASALILNGCDFFYPKDEAMPLIPGSIVILKPNVNEDIFAYIDRINGKFDLTLYKQILGSANEFKEGDKSLNISASSQQSRNYARELLGNTKIKSLNEHLVYRDELIELILRTTKQNSTLENWTLNDLKTFILTQTEEKIKEIMPSLSSDIIACLVKLMNNEELIKFSQKVFNPLPNSKIGSKGYMGARIQPNSPTDNIEDIIWQVFDGWSYAVGDVVLGTNPVSSEPESVAKIEQALFDIITTFCLENTIPNSVLSHIDIQAEVEQVHPGITGIWFQSIAGTVDANKTFDVSIEKMMKYASKRNGQYGFYAETGQGADLTNGHSNGFDMVIHESRKYGFLRALKQKLIELKGGKESWVFVNDVAGFIGPEVFKTRKQLVRCCLEDIVMGKLHGLTIGLDICSTLHMDVSLEDLDWCIEQVMPANPAYLMALPTKNDPMLSYLTTAFNNHVRIREHFGYKVNDDMWNFFKKIEIIDENGKPTEHFGDPIWVYYKYCQMKNDKRSKAEIYVDGKKAIERIESRGVPIVQGYGKNIWDLKPEINERVQFLYDDAKVCLWTELNPSFIKSIPAHILISTKSKDRKDYVYHPGTGELLNSKDIEKLNEIRRSWKTIIPDIQIIISDGLNAKAIMDQDHLFPYLNGLSNGLKENNYFISDKHFVIENGRVRTGYACGEILFGQNSSNSKSHCIINIIGERPGTEHHNFSAYLTVAKASTWAVKGKVDHNISRVVSGISDTAYHPKDAVQETVKIINEMF